MKANIVTQTAKALYDQLMIVKEANDQDFEQEAKKLASMSNGAAVIASLAETEVKLIIGTNIVPENSMLVAGIKEIVDHAKKPNKGLLTEDFNKQ